MSDRDPNRLPADDARYTEDRLADGRDAGASRESRTASEFDGFSGDSYTAREDAETRRAAEDDRNRADRGAVRDERRADRDRLDRDRDERGGRLGDSAARAGDDRFAAAARREAAATEVDEKKGGMTAGLWISLILGIVVLVALLIFVVQNNVPANFEYISWQFSLPLGVAMLLAASAGALVMALVGAVRMMQLSMQVRRYRKAHARLQETLKL